MSDSTVAAEACEAIASAHQQFDAYPAREVTFGDLAVVRALPVKGKRLIAPWCFLDRFGPATLAQGGAMDVAPHPHIGLPRVERSGGIVQVFSGALAGATSPAEHFSPLVGADLQVHARHDLTIPLEPQHALLAAAARAFRHLAPPNPVS